MLWRSPSDDHKTNLVIDFFSKIGDEKPLKNTHF
jgi:hypothetical protein